MLLRQAMVVAWVDACTSGHSADRIRSGLRRTCSDDGSNRNTGSDNRKKGTDNRNKALIIAIRELGALATLTATPTAAASRIWAMLNPLPGAAQSCTAHSGTASLRTHPREQSKGTVEGNRRREQSKGTVVVDSGG